MNKKISVLSIMVSIALLFGLVIPALANPSASADYSIEHLDNSYCSEEDAWVWRYKVSVDSNAPHDVSHWYLEGCFGDSIEMVKSDGDELSWKYGENVKPVGIHGLKVEASVDKGEVREFGIYLADERAEVATHAVIKAGAIDPVYLETTGPSCEEPPIYYTVTLSVNPANGGTVTGFGAYNSGDSVTIEATPETGWEFVDWTDDDNNDAVVSTLANYTFDMLDEDLNFTANFTARTGTITVIKDKVGEPKGELVPHVGIDFTLTNGEQTWMGTTDTEGKIVFDDLPLHSTEGKEYTLTEDIPDGWSVNYIGGNSTNLWAYEYEEHTFYVHNTEDTEELIYDISVTKDGPTWVYVGDSINYTIEVKNTGDFPLYHVEVWDDILEKSWSWDELPVGESRTVTASRTAQDGDRPEFENEVFARACLHEIVDVPEGELAALMEIPDDHYCEEWVEDDDRHVVEVRRRTTTTTIRYYNLTLEVSPEGSGTASADPDRDRYRRGVEVDISAEANEGYEFSHWIIQRDRVEDADTTVVMNGNRTATAYFVSVVEPDEPEAEPEPAISLTKTADVRSVEPGGTINYTLVVENTGEVDLTGVRLVDALFGSDWVETIEVLEPGEWMSFEEAYVVPDDFDGDAIVNTAWVMAREDVEDEARATVAVEIDEVIDVDIDPGDPEAPLPHTGGSSLIYLLLGGALLSGGWILSRRRR